MVVKISELNGEEMSDGNAPLEGGLNFSKQDLAKADFQGKNLRFANFRGANLREANLSEADLFEADLREADLKGADLRGANLKEAFLRDANLRGANLSFATNLCCVDVESAYIDKDTKFPTSIKVTWQSERKYVCHEIKKRKKSGRRETCRRFKDKGRLWGDRRNSPERRLEQDRREGNIQDRKPKKEKKSNFPKKQS